jgi:predicted phosphodiesterase
MHTLDIAVGESTKVVVASDLHIGDPRAPALNLNLLDIALRLEKPDVLILSGDVLEGPRATPKQKEQLTKICSQAKKVIVLMGNHDEKATATFASDIAADLGDCVVGGNEHFSFAVEHGNRFDSAWKKVPWLGHLAIWLNLLIYSLFKFDAQRWFRNFSLVQKNLKKQHQKAVEAWQCKDIVVTGHTHLPTGEQVGTGYFNSGDWIIHKTYVVITHGRARLEEIP